MLTYTNAILLGHVAANTNTYLLHLLYVWEYIYIYKYAYYKPTIYLLTTRCRGHAIYAYGVLFYISLLILIPYLWSTRIYAYLYLYYTYGLEAMASSRPALSLSYNVGGSAPHIN